MPIYYYGIIDSRDNIDVGFRVGKSLYEPPDEYISACREVIRKIKTLRHKNLCSRLYEINEILRAADEKCNTRLLLYILITEELGITPVINNEYVYDFEDSEFYDVEWREEVKEVCRRLRDTR